MAVHCRIMEEGSSCLSPLPWDPLVLAWFCLPARKPIKCLDRFSAVGIFSLFILSPLTLTPPSRFILQEPLSLSPPSSSPLSASPKSDLSSGFFFFLNPPFRFSMMNAPQNKYLCLNILGFKKPGISGQDYRDYMIHTHAPLVAGLMEKYGITQWSMVSFLFFFFDKTLDKFRSVNTLMYPFWPDPYVRGVRPSPAANRQRRPVRPRGAVRLRGADCVPGHGVLCAPQGGPAL